MIITEARTSIDQLNETRWFRPALGLAGLLALGISASNDEGPVLCPFRRCTGGYCPGCGFTRSTGALIRGDVAGSWRHHPYLLLIIAQVAVAAALWNLAGGPLKARLRRATQPFLVMNAVLVLGIWVFRLASGHIPVPFG